MIVHSTYRICINKASGSVPPEALLFGYNIESDIRIRSGGRLCPPGKVCTECFEGTGLPNTAIPSRVRMLVPLELFMAMTVSGFILAMDMEM